MNWSNLRYIFLFFILSASNSFAEEHLIVTHPSSLWDRNSVATAGVNSLLQTWNGVKPSILVHDFSKIDTYYVDTKKYELWNSIGGAWDFKFSSQSTVTLAGGKFSQCLCETLRDTALALDSQNDVYLHLQTIFDSPRKKEAWIFSDAEFFELTNHHLSDLEGKFDLFEAGDPVLLGKILEVLGVSRFGDYISSALRSTNLFCTQNSSSHGDTSISALTLVFKYKGQIIGSLGTGSKVINVTFL